MTRTVLIFGNYRQSLATARSLKRSHGYRCILLSNQPGGHESWSRAIDQVISVRSDSDLMKVLHSNPTAFLFPMGDLELQWILDHEHEIPATIQPLWPGRNATIQCLDKNQIQEIARKNGVPTSQTFEQHTGSSIERWASQVLFPVILKPALSGTASTPFKIKRIDDIRGLKKHFNSNPGTPTQFQKFFPGMRRNLQFFSTQGKLECVFQQKIIRTNVIDDTGYAVEGIDEPVDPRLKDWTEKLVRAIQYQGVGCAQFMVNDRTQEAIFMEINARLDANVEHAIQCGYDFPLMQLQNEIALQSAHLKSHLRFHWFTGDLQGWADAIRHRDITLIQALLWPFWMIRALIRSRTHFLYSVSDPGPALHFALMVPLRLTRRLLGIKA